jgi:hypothetical protein
MKQIDHDPRELPRKAIKLVAIATAVITLAIAIPASFGVRWAVNLMPEALLNVVFGIILGGCLGFFVGRWDAFRQRDPNTEG